MSASQAVFPSLTPVLEELFKTRQMAWVNNKPQTSRYDARGGYNNIHFNKMSIAPSFEEKMNDGLAVALSLPRQVSDIKSENNSYDSEHKSGSNSYSSLYAGTYSCSGSFSESSELTLPNPKNFMDEKENRYFESMVIRSFANLSRKRIETPFIQSVLYQDGRRKITERMHGSLRALVEYPQGVNLDIKELFAQMLCAVWELHKENLVHRDIKPANFLYQTRGSKAQDSPHIFLSDLDTIMYAGDNPDPISDNLHTEYYAAPELDSKKRNEIDRFKVDSYAMGKTFARFLILYKKHSYVKEHQLQLLKQLIILLTQADPKKRISIGQAFGSGLFGNTPDENRQYFESVQQKFKLDKHIDSFHLSGSCRYPSARDTFLVLSAPMKLIYLQLQKLHSMIHYLNTAFEQESDVYSRVYTLNVFMREMIRFVDLLKTTSVDARLTKENKIFIDNLINDPSQLKAVLYHAQEMTGNHLPKLKEQIAEIDNDFDKKKYDVSQCVLKELKRDQQRSIEMKKLYLASKGACLMEIDSTEPVLKQDRILKSKAENNYSHQEATRFIDLRLSLVAQLEPIAEKVSQAVQEYIEHNKLQKETRYRFYDVVKKHNFHGKQYAEKVLAEVRLCNSEEEMMTYLQTHYQTGPGGHNKNSFKTFLLKEFPELNPLKQDLSSEATSRLLQSYEVF